MFRVTPRHLFFVGIDSDGCVFDTMELKHKECFIPNLIRVYGLQGISRYVREAAEFVNLYSRSRGVNRFPGLIETFQWLQVRPEVAARGFKIEIPESLRKWVHEETHLGNPALEARVRQTEDPALQQALTWSQAVNGSVAETVRGVPPFALARESVTRLGEHCDLLVVSGTPGEALQAEWQEHDLAQYVQAICGQEQGSKKQLLANAAAYAPGHALMIGDAPGDHAAAAANDCLFFPIVPGAEESSWQEFHDQGIDRFLQGTFRGAYQQRLLAEFYRHLPERPPWAMAGGQTERS